MTILVDIPRWVWRGSTWCHLVSDESLDELHEFARQLGLKRIGFQGDHYDIDASHHEIARNHGAELCESRELVRRLRTAGLRLRPGSFEKWTLVEEFPEWSRHDWFAGDSHTEGLGDLLATINVADVEVTSGFQLRRSNADALVLQGPGAGPTSQDDASRGCFYRRETVVPYGWSFELISPSPAMCD